jgi:competence ComEA-like helix-hairpin-helix protein
MRRARIFASLFLSLLTCAHAFAKQKPLHPIDLNVANQKELEELPGVGATTAKAILDFREKGGKFHRIEDLLAIRGISETKLQKMRPYITVAAAAPATATKSAQAPKTSTPPKTSTVAKPASSTSSAAAAKTSSP